MQKSSHFRIEGTHQLAGTLHDRDFHTLLSEIFSQLQSDKAAAGQNDRAGLLLPDEIVNAEGVFHGAQGEKPVQSDSGQIRLCGSGSGRKEKLVVAFLKHSSGFQILHGDGLLLRVDGGDLVAHLHFHTEPLPEAFRRLESQFFRVCDNAADVIGQSAVCVGHIAGPFEYKYLRGFIKPPDAGGRSGASRHSSDNYNLHSLPLHSSVIAVDASQIGHMGVAHVLQARYGLPASGAAEAVDEQRGAGIWNGGFYLIQFVQGNVSASGNSPFGVFFVSAHIQQNGAGRSLIFFQFFIDIGHFQKIKESHRSVLHSV